MVEGVLCDLGMRVVTLALDSWSARNAECSEVRQFRHLVEAAVRLTDVEERRRQISPLLHPLQSLLHTVGGDREQAHVLHLALAAAYAAIGEDAAQFYHLNRACDCAIRVMQTTWRNNKKVVYCRLRDELLDLLGDHREVLIG
jgi:hypothetical protein